MQLGRNDCGDGCRRSDRLPNSVRQWSGSFSHRDQRFPSSLVSNQIVSNSVSISTNRTIAGVTVTVFRRRQVSQPGRQFESHWWPCHHNQNWNRKKDFGKENQIWWEDGEREWFDYIHRSFDYWHSDLELHLWARNQFMITADQTVAIKSIDKWR